jgi:hypothetical protein
MLRPGDTVASVVDTLQIPVENFMLEQISRQQMRSAATIQSTWRYENVTYKLVNAFDADVLDKMLKVADNVFMLKNKAPYQPYIRCWHYDANGLERTTTCTPRTGASACLQHGVGTVGCALHYADIAVPDSLDGGTNQSVVVCSVKHPYFADPGDSQVRTTLCMPMLDIGCLC